MVIIKLQGGLGNQMFQYALGLSLSKKLDSKLYTDNSFYIDRNHNLTDRNYGLGLFHIPANAASEAKIRRFLRPCFFDRILNKLGTSPTVYRETSLKFDRRVFDVNPPVYVEGFWQSEKYFNTNEDLVRDNFTFKEPLNTESQKIVDEIAKQAETVSVHIRRGDYVSSKTTAEVHGICSVKYYKDAIALVAGRLTSPHFYFFSDDTQWVNENLIPSHENCTLVQHNTGASSWQDMALMSKCKHHIIANSSFSWWGAWLNPCKEKIVIAPQNWFSAKANYFDDDIVPHDWIRIPN